jgi:hypothetical protein
MTEDPKYYRCPVCQNNLMLDDGILNCTAVPGHFQIKQKIFEAAWEKYDHEVLTAEKLLKLLGNANTAPDKPRMEEA